ncbi:MAG TPA: hypothetical protein PLS63_04375 [Microthrixaceae bacterium]|nr:hypothetical protein [Microthrixaceae bacterium]
MTQWEERISGGSDVLLLAEHQVRYGWAKGPISSATTWCDLGCGTAAASSVALGDTLPDRVVLTDLELDALTEARRAFSPVDVDTVQVDLTSRSALDELTERIDGDGPTVITCFEVIEHLPDFLPVVEWLSARAADGATVAISVPNDVFTSVKNPFHVTMWGSSTVEELRGLLPTDHVAAVQVALSGSAVTAGAPVEGSLHVDDIGAAIPLQYLFGFGTSAEDLSPNAAVLPTEVAAQRVWERQREVDNAYFRSEAAQAAVLRERVAELEAELGRLRNQVGQR